MIPLVDLAWQHSQIEHDVRAGWDEVLGATSFILGPQVPRFEDRFASYSDVQHCIGVANGTDALELALRALGLGSGHKVVVPANTFIASALAVLRAGADVVLVDCDADTYLLDGDGLKASVLEGVSAVIPVHLYGQAAPVERIRAIVGEVPILEDAAQSQGARRHGTRCGALGDIAATSFYPGKNLGCYGDGGAVLTNDSTLASRVRRLRNWGSTEKYHHPHVGFNSRLDSLQAVVLDAKLDRLEQWNEMRREAAARYDRLLASLDVVLPQTMEGNEHVWHLYVIRVHDRDRVGRAMSEAGIGVGIHYPVPVHLHGAMSHLGYGPGDFPVAERVAGEILSLPMFPGITEAQQERVVTILDEVLTA